MKKRVFALLLTAGLVLGLAACGASKDASTGASAPAASAPTAEAPMSPSLAPAEKYEVSTSWNDAAADMAPAESDGGNAGESGSIPGGQKLIRTAHIEMETTEFDSAAAALEDLTTKLGGYYERSSVSNYRSGQRWGEYTIRIPAQQSQDFLDQAGDLCHVTRQESMQDDISEVYYDTAGRLKTQQIKLERLQQLLAKAEKMEDIITIESAISETEWTIEDLSGTLRHYDGQVDYATVSISLSEVYKLSNVEEVPDSFMSRLGKAFSGGLADFADGLENFAVALAYGWMWVLFLAVVVVVVVRVLRKRRKAKKTDDKPEKP